MNLEIITKQVVVLSKEVGHFIKQEVSKLINSDIEEKGIHNLVTYVDKQSEKIIVKELHKLLPEAGFIAEEDDSLQKPVDLIGLSIHLMAQQISFMAYHHFLFRLV